MLLLMARDVGWPGRLAAFSVLVVVIWAIGLNVGQYLVFRLAYWLAQSTVRPEWLAGLR